MLVTEEEAMNEKEEAMHTPGPWWRIGARVYAASLNQLDDVDEPLNIAVADCDMDMRIDHDTTAEANAALIAAAPALYDALKKLVDAADAAAMGFNTAMMDEAIETGRRALSAAKKQD